VSFRHESEAHYNLVFMNAEGRYVVLASDPGTSCNHPVLLAPRVAPQLPASVVDYRRNTGVFTMENIYHGPGLANVPAGTVKKLRVVALKYRAAVVGGNGNRGPAGGGGVKTPVGASNTSWDAKRVLGEAEVYSDGSAAFEVPARTPVYFQAIDANGHVAQTMRSWSTLQPGETFSCIGCHESRFEAPPVAARSIASQRGPQELSPFYDVPADGFSYTKIIQPIWDKRCVSCHNASTTNGIDLSENPRITGRRDRLHYARSYYNLVNQNQTTAGVRSHSVDMKC
jgi:cytochrome c553